MNSFINFPKRKRIRFFLITCAVLIGCYLIYSAIWYHKYPVTNWNTYTNTRLGIQLKYPANIKITANEVKLESGGYIASANLTDENITKSTYPADPENVAYKRVYDCQSQHGNQCVDTLVRGFFLTITKGQSGYDHFSEAYYKINSYRTLNIDGYTAHIKEEWKVVPPGLGKQIIITLYKGNDRINFTGEFPINDNDKMYSRLFDQIISTVKIIN